MPYIGVIEVYVFRGEHDRGVDEGVGRCKKLIWQGKKRVGAELIFKFGQLLMKLWFWHT